MTFGLAISYLRLPSAKGNLAPPTPVSNYISVVMPQCSDGIIVAWGEIALEGAIRPIIGIPGWTNTVPAPDRLNTRNFGFRDFYLVHALNSHLPMQVPANYGSGILPIDETYPLVIQQIDNTLLEFGVNQVNLFGHSRGGLFARRALSEQGIENKVEHLFAFASPQHGSTSSIYTGPFVFGAIYDAACRGFSGDAYQNCLDSGQSLKPLPMRYFNFIECENPSIFIDSLYQDWERPPASFFETIYGKEVHPERNCTPNPSTWEQDVIYYSIAGFDDLHIGVDVTAMYPWETYDWQRFGAPFPRPDAVNIYGPKTDLNSLWDYYYTCPVSRIECHDYIPQAIEPFCFTIGKLLETAQQGDLSRIVECRNIDLDSTGVLLEPLSTSSQLNTSTHDLVLGELGRQIISKQVGNLGSNQTISYTFPMSATDDVLFTIQSYPALQDFALSDPLNNLVVPNGITATNSILTDTGFVNFYQYKVIAPSKGTWTIHFTSTATNTTNYEISAYVGDTIQLDTALSAESTSPSSNVHITASLRNISYPVSMTTIIRHPDGVTQTINLVDDGTNGDSTPNDGYYVGQFSTGSSIGHYEIATYASKDDLLRTNYNGVAVTPNSGILLSVSGEETPDNNSNGLYDNLTINARFYSIQEGHYTIRADLLSADGKVAEASYSTQVDLSSTFSAFSANVVPLIFSGEDIFAKGQNGPYTVTNVTAIDESGFGFVVDREYNQWVTPSYLASQFDGTRRILLSDINYQTEDINSNGLYDSLQFDLGAHSDFTGTFRISGRLVDEMGQTIEWTENQLTISNTGKITASLQFSGTAISAHQEHGNYTLQDVSMMNTVGDQWNQYKITTTIPYSYTQFEGLQALSVSELQISLNSSQVILDWADMGISYEVWLNDEAYPVTNGDCLSLSHCTVQSVNQFVIDLENLPAGLQTVVIVGAQNAVRTQESDPLGIFTVPLEVGD